MRPLVLLCSISIALLLLTGSTGLLLAQAPANDECSGATIVSTLPFSVSQNTRLATVNAADPLLTCAGDTVAGMDGKTVWFRYIADSTRFVDFTTEGSNPSDYDIAMGIFTGSCGSLSMVACNDDIIQGVVRASRIRMQVTSGTIYTILVGEWNGGGPSGGVPTGGDLLFRICSDSCPPPPIPLVKGPKSGSVASGAVVTTNSFAMVPMAFQPGGGEVREAAERNYEPALLPAPDDVTPPKGPEGSNYIEERTIPASPTVSSQPVVMRNFLGMPNPGQGIPPDPIMAVGPNDVMVLNNSTFRILDKNGNVLKSINAAAWFNSVKPGAGPFDPQVVYDQFADRWVMTWDNISTDTTAELFISVSDDSDPLGTWYNWCIPANVLGDSVTHNFSDYPGLGFDNQALYICSNEFGITVGGGQYTKVRIVGKAQLYANTAGPITWTDFWDFREPDHRSVGTFGIRSTITFGTPGTEFLLTASPYAPGTFFTLWKINNPLTSPTVTGINIPVVQYNGAPAADQLGGSGSNPIETGGSGLKFQPVYRDSSLWVAHSIASGSSDQYSAVRYIRFNPFTNTSLEDVAMGLDGYWHYYASLMVDQDDNVAIVYTRSGLTEYAGAFLSGRRNTDPPGLSPSVPLKVGAGNYVVVGGGRNRWGDYNGIGLDPADGNAMWAVGEYTPGTDNFGSWVGEIKMAPVPGRYVYASPVQMKFGIFEQGTTGDTLSGTVANYGLDTLTITNISIPDTNFVLLNPPATPFRLSTFSSQSFNVVFKPKKAGVINASVVITSDDTSRSPFSIPMTGTGFFITQAQVGTLYATTSDFYGGLVLTVDPRTGASSSLGASGYAKIVSARVNPNTHELVGLVQTGANFTLVRVNSAAGDAHPATLISQNLLKGLAFRDDTMYVGRISGQLYRVDPHTGTFTQIASTGLSYTGLAWNPITQELWACGKPLSSPNVDHVYRISLPGGALTDIGSTGLGLPLEDIVFDANGVLVGTIGATSPSSLVLIDTVSGAGTVVGPFGYTGIQALALDPATALPAFVYSFAANWNMLSVPYQLLSNHPGQIFPTAVSRLFTYQAGYSVLDTVPAGLGFWLKFGGPTATPVLGVPAARESVSVAKPWNIIGSIASPIPAGAVVSTPPGIVASNYLTYQGGGYVIADSILPGKAYWVRVSDNGGLLLSSAAASPKTTAAQNDVQFLQGCNSIAVRDARNAKQSLFFGREGNDPIDLSRFELPPPPPEDGLNARFASNRLVELHPSRPPSAVEFPIIVHSPSMPVQIGWHVADDAGVRYSLVVVNRKSSRVSTTVMRSEGSASFNQQDLADLRLRVEQNLIPIAFALRQNYPNPFNPTTRIRYELPSDRQVTLVVYDILGKEVATLVHERQTAGYYEVPFSGEALASGIYFYRLTAGTFVSVQKMMLVK